MDYNIGAKMPALIVNGKKYEVDVDPETPLLWVLRERLKLTGTKYACGISVCGSCTVLLNGEPVRSCVTTLAMSANQEITTIEGLSVGKTLHPIQQAWLDESVPECGYCQSGQIMTAVALLNNKPDPTDEDIDQAMSAVLCRCGTYLKVRKAIKRAVRKSKGVV